MANLSEQCPLEYCLKLILKHGHVPTGLVKTKMVEYYYKHR